MCCEDVIASILIGVVKEDGIHITTLGTTEDHRRQGMGLSLLEYCRQDMVKRHVEEMYLNVHIDNTPAYEMYKRLGFKEKQDV